MSDVLSFRGRAGWHVVFNYRVEAEGTPRTEFETQWFATSDLPRTMHGRWEVDIIRRLSQGEERT